MQPVNNGLVCGSTPPYACAQATLYSLVRLNVLFSSVNRFISGDGTGRRAYAAASHGRVPNPRSRGEASACAHSYERYVLCDTENMLMSGRVRQVSRHLGSGLLVSVGGGGGVTFNAFFSVWKQGTLHAKFFIRILVDRKCTFLLNRSIEFTHTHTHTYTHTHIYYTYTNIYNMHTYTLYYTNIHTHILCTHTYSVFHTHIHTYITYIMHTHTHTHTHHILHTYTYIIHTHRLYYTHIHIYMLHTHI